MPRNSSTRRKTCTCMMKSRKNKTSMMMTQEVVHFAQAWAQLPDPSAFLLLFASLCFSPAFACSWGRSGAHLQWLLLNVILQDNEERVVRKHGLHSLQCQLIQPFPHLPCREAGARHESGEEWGYTAARQCRKRYTSRNPSCDPILGQERNNT